MHPHTQSVDFKPFCVSCLRLAHNSYLFYAVCICPTLSLCYLHTYKKIQTFTRSAIVSSTIKPFLVQLLASDQYMKIHKNELLQISF